MYSSKNSNPFLDDDEVSASPSSGRGYTSTTSTSGYGYRESLDPVSDRRAQLRMQIDDSEERQLASTQRALASIYDSERMGIATAEELVRQGEQLDNIEKKNDEMTDMMKTSQKHLNNIKSVFGGIKNWWSGKKSQSETEKPRESKLRDTVERDREERERESGSHPALRLKSEDGRGFYNDDDDDLDSRFMARSRVSNHAQRQNGPMLQQVTKSEKEQRLNENLDMMSDGMSKLKMLAMNLGDEIETQNDQLDRINLKTDKTDTLLEGQNAQMRKILHK